MKYTWKHKQVLDRTADSKEYRRARHRKIALDEGLCSLCHPHKGCNSRRRDKPTRSWKEYRKTQWKEKTHIDSGDKLRSERTDCSDDHMSYEKYEEGVSTPQKAREVRAAA